MTQVPARIRSMLEESGIDADDAVGLVDALAALEEEYVDAAPVPAPALADLMGGTATSRPPTPRPRSRRVLVAGVVACGAVAATGGLAAANELPAPAQRWLAELSARYLPFDLPHPPEAHGDGTGTGRPPGDAVRESGGSAREAGGRGDDAHDSRPLSSRPDTSDEARTPALSGHRHRDDGSELAEAGEGDLVDETSDASEHEEYAEESGEPAREGERRTDVQEESDPAVEPSWESSESSTDETEGEAPEREEQPESTEGSEDD